MPFKFNPFSGNFDQTGSGGGASYIDGEEATYNDLSLDAGVAPLNSAWLVRNSSGIWPFNKPGGIYIRTATGGSSRDSDYTYAGTMPDVFSDAVLTIYDEASTTRTGQFNLGSVTAGQNRVLTWPNANGTIARTQDFAAPPAIGNTTAAAANFTTVGATGAITGAEATSTSVRSLANGFQLPVAASSGAVGILSTFFGSGNELRIYSANSGGTVSNMATFNAGSGLASFTALSATPTANTAALTSTGYSLTGSNAQSLVDLAGTWNTTGVPIAFKTNLTVTAAGSNSMYADFQVGGYSQFGVSRISSTSNALWLYNSNSGTNTNGVGANHERGFMRWTSNILQIGTEKLGTGTRRALELVTDGAARWKIGDGSISSAPSMLAIGNVGVFGTNEAYSVIIATGSQGTINAGVFSPNASNTGYLAIGESLHLGLLANGSSGDVRLVRDAANVLALRNGASTPQAYRIYNTVSGTSNVNFERANFRWASNEFIIDAEFGGTGTALRGIKLGSATSSLLGFYGVTPVDQPATVADPAGGGTVDTEARTAINAIIDRLQELGLIA